MGEMNAHSRFCVNITKVVCGPSIYGILEQKGNNKPGIYRENRRYGGDGMKIRCRECGKKFQYEPNSGICPKCMEYNPWTDSGRAPKYSSGHRFFRWASCFVAATVLVIAPVVYHTRRARQLEWEEYTRKLEEESKGEHTQEIGPGQPIRAGAYYVTPGAGYWLPELWAVGLTDNGNYILVVPVHIVENEESPKDRGVEFRLESQGAAIESYSLSVSGRDYWPGLEQRLLDYGYRLRPETEQQYLIFETEERPNPLTLVVEESVNQPDTYETTITRVYKTPLTMETGGGEAGEPFMEHARPLVRTIEQGAAFDYYESRLVVEQVQCVAETGDISVPGGSKLVTALIRRESDEWPHTNNISAFTAMAGRNGNVYPNTRNWDVASLLDTNLSDLWGYYYDYNYVSEYSSKKREYRENPDTVYQCYFVDEDETDLELIFPGVTGTDEQGGAPGYWQIRIPVKLPANSGIDGDLRKAPAEGRLRR